MSSPEGNKENGPRVDNHNNNDDDGRIQEDIRKDWSRGRRRSPPSRRRRSSSSSRSSSSRSRSRSPRYSSRRDDYRSSRGGRSSYDRSYDDDRRYYDRDDRYYTNDHRRGGGGRDRDYPPNDDHRRHPRDSHPIRHSNPRWEPPPPRDNRPPQKAYPEYRIVNAPKDDKLGDVRDDPRGEDPTKRITQKAAARGNGRNTESFDPASTLVRPDLRVLVASNQTPQLNKPLKHDDVVIVPELFGAEDDWTLYYKLVEEMRQVQKQGNVKGSEWISWHEGAHLICKNPTGSPTFSKIIDRLCEYFSIRKESIGTRFNWYHDSSDWKPFHHDSAAFNPQRARNQNITVGVSFGATRELAFIRAEPLQNEEKVRIYFPQTNNGVFSFGRDANILWKHGINALPPAEQDGKGRISIILWGLAQNVIEEEGSPPLLGSDGQGPHASMNNNNNNNHRKRNNQRRGSRGRGGGGGRRNANED